MRRIQQVAVGNTHKCALFEDGGVRCWGKSEVRVRCWGVRHIEYLGVSEPVGDNELPFTVGGVAVH